MPGALPGARGACHEPCLPCRPLQEGSGGGSEGGGKREDRGGGSAEEEEVRKQWDHWACTVNSGVLGDSFFLLVHTNCSLVPALSIVCTMQGKSCACCAASCRRLQSDWCGRRSLRDECRSGVNALRAASRASFVITFSTIQGLFSQVKAVQLWCSCGLPTHYLRFSLQGL